MTEIRISDIVAEVRELVDEWINQCLEEGMTMSQLSEMILNSSAPGFPKMSEEMVEEAYDIAWEILVTILKKQIQEGAYLQGLDMEALDPAGSGVDDWIIWRVLEGQSITDVVADWADWKRQDLLERENES